MLSLRVRAALGLAAAVVSAPACGNLTADSSQDPCSVLQALCAHCTQAAAQEQCQQALNSGDDVQCAAVLDERSIQSACTPHDAGADAPAEAAALPACGATASSSTACACTGSCAPACPAGGCSITCASGTCSPSCAGGECDVTCESGARCASTCAGGGCRVACKAGSTCDSTCAGGGCTFQCEDGAVCDDACEGAAACVGL